MDLLTMTVSPRETPWFDSRDRPVFFVGLVVAGAVLVAMATGSGTLALLACAIALIAAVASPMAGLVVFAFLVALRMPIVFPPPGFHSLLVAAMVIGMLFRLPTERPRFLLGAPAVMLLAFGAYVFLQQLPDMTDGYQGVVGHQVGFQIIQLLTGIGAALIAAMILRGRSPYPVMTALLISACIAAFLSLLTFESLPTGPLAHLVANADEDAIRPSGAFGNPNYFGAYMATAAMLATGLMVFARTRVQRYALMVVLVLFAAALLLAQSRGGIAALCAGLVAQAFVHSRRAGWTVLIVGGLAALVAFPVFVEWRLTNLTGSASPLAYALTERSDAVRYRALLAGPGLFLDSPIVGVGFAHYRYLAGIEAHNWFMTVLAELGLVGIVLWGLVLAAAAAAVRRTVGVARMIGAGLLVVTVVASVFLEPPVNLQTAALVYLGLAAVLVATWERSRGLER